MILFGLFICSLIYAIIGFSLFLTCVSLNDEYAAAKGLTWPVMFWKKVIRARWYCARPESVSKMWNDELAGNKTSHAPERRHRER